MFNKKTRRNFRQRKQASSEDEGEQKNKIDEEEKSEAVPLKKLLHPIQRRGISCSSKHGEETPKLRSTVEDDGESSKSAEERKHVKNGIKMKTNALRSFSDGKGNGYEVNVFHPRCIK